jgi:VLRF1 release factor-like protein
MISNGASVFNIKPGQYLSKTGLERLLSQWTPASDLPSSSLFLRPDEPARFLAAPGEAGRDWAQRLPQLDDAVLKLDTGLVGLQAGDQALSIVPPFPILENKLVPSWDTAPLLAVLEANYTVGVALLRLGRYLVAIFQGEGLLSTKTDSRYVKGRHRAGGSSQRRFERIREGQMRRIYDETCAVVRSQFEPYAQQLDYILLGGERFTLSGLLKVCPYLQQFQGITLNRRLNVRDPKRDTLEEVRGMLRQSQVYPLQW